MNFFDILLAKKEAGGGDAVLKQKTVTQNGTYNASSDSADGYSKVTVSVPASAVDTGTKSISTNGTHDVIGYASANVSVPASAVDTGTKSITSNGTHDVVGYASASVNVPNSYTAADEGKVVSGGALVAQTSDTVTANDTYDTTLINSMTVNVSGGASITNGIVVNSTDADGYPTDIDYYGTDMFADCFGCGRTDQNHYLGKIENIDFKSLNSITEIPAYAFRSAGVRGNGIGALSFPNVTNVGVNAFWMAKISSLTLPALTTITAAQVFLSYSPGKIASIYLPVLSSCPNVANNGFCRSCQATEYVEIGSVGHAAPDNVKYNFKDCSQAGLTICIYCVGSQVDGILTTLRTEVTQGTVIFKASEATTYNGNSYAAGSTMLTSTV